MNIALLGHGTMGRLIEDRAAQLGHNVALILTTRDAERDAEEIQLQLSGLDAVIDFSVAGAVMANVALCARAGVPLVIGTTGWQKQEDAVRQLIKEQNGALIFGANFSIGVNLFYRVVERAAELFAGFDEYAPFIDEAHHARKRDAPSGTAMKLHESLGARYESEIPVSSTRAGYIPGTHSVGFDSLADQVLLTHAARTREGFAAGALAAASWIQGRRGFYKFEEMIDEILKERMKKT